MSKTHTTDCCGSDHQESIQTEPAKSPSTIKKGHVQTRLYIEAMDCPLEEQLIRTHLQENPAISHLQFHLVQRQLVVLHQAQALDSIRRVLTEIGMQNEVVEGEDKPLNSSFSLFSFRRIACAVLIALGAEVGSWLNLPTWFVFGLALVAIYLSGFDVYKKGIVALRHKQISINALMSIAVTGAILLGEWPEAAMVMSLFALAELLEAYSLDRANRAVDSLLQMTPEDIEVQNAIGDWQWQQAQTVVVNSIIRVKPGERIGLDGTVVKGQSDVNQAPITGESMPVLKVVGDPVYAGSINGMAELQVRTTGDYDQSLLSKIAQTVRQAQQSKAPVQRFVDRFAQIYTPIVLIIALAIAVLGPIFIDGNWQQWAYKALVLLVIACPCALVISTPVAVVSALATAARAGLLIKGGSHLERARHIDYLALDKTGTLTLGRPQLQDQWIAKPSTESEVLQMAYALASRSDHPASMALAQSLVVDTNDEVQSFQAIPGNGVQAKIAGQYYQLGRFSWVSAQSMPPMLQQWQAKWAQQGASFVYLSHNQEVIAAFAIADQIKKNVSVAIAELKALGVHTEVLSGDHHQAVTFVARQLDIPIAKGDLMPEDKLRLIQERAQHYRSTAMVGDGINDAPALAQADLSFAMGALGSDMAIETADIAIMNDELNAIPYTIRLSRGLHQILVQNISAALGIKAVFLLLAVTGFASMWMAVFADVGASLLVVLNSLRLLKAHR